MRKSPRNVMQYMTRFLALICGLLAVTMVQAGSFTVTVVDGNGDPIADADFGFRWLLQERCGVCCYLTSPCVNRQ